jgi:colanic acid/amylovoran biosynthesis glycosyltransferase
MTDRVTGSPGAPRIAYVMSRFPKLTETFVVSEIVALEERGVPVAIYPLLREQATVVQPEARPLVARARYLPFLSAPILRANLRALRRDPRRYLGTLAAVARATLGSRNYFLGGLALFPKVVRMAELMRAEGIRHVHCHFSNHPAMAGFVIRRLTGIPYSFTAHGSDLHRDRHMLREKVAEAAFVVAISEYNRRLIVETCEGRWADRVRVIHSGIDTRRFRPVARRPPGPLSILCIGTLHEVKGQAHLVDACRLLRKAGLTFHCRLVGEGEDRAALERQIRAAGLEDAVTLEGPRTRDEILELLARSDVLVTPSVPTRDGRREGIPVVLMEAMASGLPVVASRISGIPELVEDGVHGFLVPPGDSPGIAQALQRLHEDPDLRTRMGRAGRARVEDAFDASRSAEILAEAFGAGRPGDQAAPPAEVPPAEVPPAEAPPAEAPAAAPGPAIEPAVPSGSRRRA